jgi:hypothetical protein
MNSVQEISWQDNAVSTEVRRHVARRMQGVGVRRRSKKPTQSQRKANAENKRK